MAAQPDPWWDTRYKMRQRITINNMNAGDVVVDDFQGNTIESDFSFIRTKTIGVDIEINGAAD